MHAQLARIRSDSSYLVVDVLLFSVFFFFILFEFNFQWCEVCGLSLLLRLMPKWDTIDADTKWRIPRNLSILFQLFLWTMGESLCLSVCVRAGTCVMCICSSFWPTFVDLILLAPCLLLRYCEWNEIEDRRPSSIGSYAHSVAFVSSVLFACVHCHGNLDHSNNFNKNRFTHCVDWPNATRWIHYAVACAYL